MTRTEKIRLIRIYRPSLYMVLQRKVPKIIVNPYQATAEEIEIYNNCVAKESKKDNNKTAFKNRFSF